MAGFVVASAVAVAAPSHPAEAGSDYVALPSPARLVDTRPGFTTIDGQDAGDGRRTAQSTMTVQVADRAGIPADATAVVLNVAAVDPLGPGHITVHPTGTTRPNASNINHLTGQTIANTVIARLGTGRAVSIYTYAATHVIVDVAGHLPTSSYTPLDAPARLADTRPGFTTIDGQDAGNGRRTAQSTMTVQVADRAGIPADATAVVLNVAAVDPLGPGHITVHPTGTTRPNASSINHLTGQTIANTVIARLGTGRAVSIYAYAATHVIVDVAGHLPTSSYTPLDAPARLADTRPGFTTIDGQDAGNGRVPGGHSLQLEVTGRAGVPLDASAVVLNVAAVDPLGPGHITVHPTGTARPNASNINHSPGQTIANTVVARLGAGGQVCISAHAATHLVVDVAGHLAGPAPPATGSDCEQPQQIAYARAEAPEDPWMLPALWLMDADGSDQRRLDTGIYVDGGPDWSPDGTQLAFTGFDPGVSTPLGVVPDVWIVDADGTGLRNLTDLPGPNHAVSLSWSPDGQQIAYVTTAWDIWIIDADGTDNRRITNDVLQQDSVDWSPDGALLLYNANVVDGTVLTGTSEIWTIEPGGGNPTRLTDPGNLGGPTWSPDGSEIAFVEWDFSGAASDDHSDVWIMNADGSGQRNLTDDPTRFDGSPAWSPDGTMIAFDSEGPFGPYVDPASGDTECCVNDPPADIYVMRAAGGPKTQLTFGDAIEVWPAWQPHPTGGAAGP